MTATLWRTIEGRRVCRTCGAIGQRDERADGAFVVVDHADDCELADLHVELAEAAMGLREFTPAELLDLRTRYERTLDALTAELPA